MGGRRVELGGWGAVILNSASISVKLKENLNARVSPSVDVFSPCDTALRWWRQYA